MPHHGAIDKKWRFGFPPYSPILLVASLCFLGASLAGESSAQQYTYDSAGHLGQATYTNGGTTTVVSYTYDANGNLLRRDVAVDNGVIFSDGFESNPARGKRENTKKTEQKA